MKRLACLLLIAVLALAPATGRAQSADDAFAALASPSFETIRQGVGMLALSGHPQAAAILSALQANRLFARTTDKALFIKADDGSFVDAATGEPAADVMASGLKPVRVNNAVRGEVEAALGSLRLFAPDAATRLDAAEAVFHSHDPAALPALDRALRQESDAGVKAAHGAGACRRPAVRRRCQRGRSAGRDRRAARTRRHRQPQPAGIAVGPDVPPWRRPPLPRSTAIDRNLQLWSILQSIYYGLSLGSVLLLAAAGLAITFGVMGVINMAHGEMVMIGAYVTFMVQQAIRAAAPGCSAPAC